MESQYIPLSHDMSNLVYHIVIPAGYRRFAITETVEQSLKQICEGDRNPVGLDKIPGSGM